MNLSLGREPTPVLRHEVSKDDISSLPSLHVKLGFVFLWVGFIPRQTISMWKQMCLPKVPSSPCFLVFTKSEIQSLSFIEFTVISPTPEILSDPATTFGQITLSREKYFDWWAKWLSHLVAHQVAGEMRSTWLSAPSKIYVKEKRMFSKVI